MKKLLLLFSLTLLTSYGVFAQTDFELDTSQSMLMTGKGPGQDATINPFEDKDCYTVVKNTGKREFYIRVQKEGKIIEELTVLKKETKKVKLLKGYELYLDPNRDGKAKARVSYEKLDE
ncbi:hypothetical protein E4S40_10110 [Algoriphagus kandeliae]|uniref:Uncharacterized protein n=1 Tax=Algoriphagus kandeliae TaxID=2562278 RepID=A0A4Y9QQ97_9BACT|nr:hypothetical protein [Algoriphagus kandeliae]TFV94370.1 hypothetical protein E4S40_10110 [Algoriphagus kandeliae]